MSDERAVKDIKKARNSVFRLLKYRPRSEFEIRDKLKQKKIPAAVIDETCRYFRDLDLINDRQFAQSWIRYRLLRPFGLNRIRFELRAKGVEDDIIAEELEHIREDYDELGIVTEIARKRLKKFKSLDKNKAQKRIYDYLLRRGFKTDTIIKALRKL